MKAIITELNLSAGLGVDDGLGPIAMTRLTPVVALAGPNGAGKTRLLKRIKTEMHFRQSGPSAEELREQLPFFEQHEHLRPRGEAMRASLQRLGSMSISVPKCRVVELSPDAHALSPPGNATPGKLAEAAVGGLASRKFATVCSSALLTLQAVANDWLSATHQNTAMDALERQRSMRRFEGLNALLDHLAGDRVVCNRFNHASLLGFPLTELPGKLSLGQARLIQFAALLFEPEADTEDLLILMDEPENHLHASSVVGVLEALFTACPSGQIWIATHSVPVLAHLDPASLWCMSEGRAYFGGNRSGEILTSLLGGPDNVSRVAAFLRRPAEVAAATFAAECMQPPAAADTRHADPQLVQILGLLEDARGERDALRVLDWGAGQGRLGRALVAHQSAFDYYAYERDPDLAEGGAALAAEIAGDEETRWFSTESSLCSQLSGQKVDVVVMCNVLHEVHPREWKATFDGVAEVLQSKGQILIVEDLRIPHGELAHPAGFVLLDGTGVRELFSDQDGERVSVYEHPESRFATRLHAFLVPRSAIVRVCADSITAALEWTRRQARRRIDELRAADTGSYQDGRELALHLAQFANASICAEGLR
ncbi:MAG: AAA family ATPase [Deltaproteobacteria bacterium]|nr:AAA family ATPase [Deltaproteobacteria bacterium]